MCPTFVNLKNPVTVLSGDSSNAFLLPVLRTNIQQVISSLMDSHCAVSMPSILYRLRNLEDEIEILLVDCVGLEVFH